MTFWKQNIYFRKGNLNRLKKLLTKVCRVPSADLATGKIIRRLAQTYELIARSLKSQGNYVAAMKHYQYAFSVLSGLPKASILPNSHPLIA